MSTHRSSGGRPPLLDPPPTGPGYPPSAETELGGGAGLGPVFRTLLRRWWMPVLGAVLALGLAWLLIPQSEPLYRATAVVRMDDARRALTGGLTSEGQENLKTQEFIVSQVHVIRSRALIGEVVDREGLRLQPVESFPPGLLQEVAVQADAASDTLWLQPLNERAFSVRLGRQHPITAEYGVPVELGGVRFSIKQPLVEESVYLAIVGREEAVDRVLSTLAPTPRDKTAIIDIHYRDVDADRARRVVNTVAQGFQDHNTRGVGEIARRRREFVESQAMQAQENLDRALQALSDFRSRGRLYSSRDRIQAEQTGLLNLESQREQMEAERRVFQAFLARVEQARDASIDQEVRTLISAPTGAPLSPIISQLFGQLVQYQSERESLLAAGRSTTHPDVERLSSLITTTRTNLVAAARTHIGSLELRIGTLAERRDRSAATIRALPDSEAEEMRLGQEVESARRMADMLRDEYQRARVSEAVDVGQVEILDFATFAAIQAADRRAQKLGIALFFGLLLGSGAALLLEATNASIRQQSETEHLLHVPVLGTIPNIADGEHRQRRPSGGEGRLVPSEFHTLAAEAYRMLRTNLVFLNRDRELTTLVVSSAVSGEGKTTTAVNLAAAFARQGKQVLLVDCDLRRPRVHEVFKVERDPGFVDLVLGDATAAQVVRPTSVNRLYVMPRGRFDEDVAEMLSGSRMRRFLSTFGSRFDLIVLDTSPVMLTADATSLAAMADGVLLVVRAGSTHRETARHSVRKLQMVGAQVVGVVFNDPESIAARYDDYSYVKEYYSVNA
jgi:capsular exopolysaccharide synthesis family protein